MVDLINTSNPDDLSAFITAAFISHTYKVESSHSIVEIWNNIRQSLKVANNLDFVSALLAIGRMMDLKNEINETTYISMINEVIETILNDLKKRGHSPDLHESNFLTAMITSACISRTDEIETINEIINHWENVNEKFIIKNDQDKLAGILTIGRINEYKYSIENVNQIVEVYNKMKEFIEPAVGDNTIKQKDVAAAFLTSAYLEITPKVEKIQDMVSTWRDLKKGLSINDNMDYVSAILAYGRIRDLDAQFFLTDTGILDIKDNIKSYIVTKK